MGFRPQVAEQLKIMDARIFQPGLMGLGDHVHGKARRYRSERVARWHADRGETAST
jgi:propionate CoA-transferase